MTSKEQPLVMGTEAAAILGTSRQRVYYLSQHDANFPKAVAVVGAGQIWDTKAIKAYAKTRNKTTGRPRNESKA